MADMKLHVEHIASLASLEISSSDKESISNELGKVLEYINQLEVLDTDGIEADFRVHDFNISNLRDDLLETSLSQDAVLGIAPDRDNVYFRVPPTLGGNE